MSDELKEYYCNSCGGFAFFCTGQLCPENMTYSDGLGCDSNSCVCESCKRYIAGPGDVYLKIEAHNYKYDYAFISDLLYNSSLSDQIKKDLARRLDKQFYSVMYGGYNPTYVIYDELSSIKDKPVTATELKEHPNKQCQEQLMKEILRLKYK